MKLEHMFLDAAKGHQWDKVKSALNRWPMLVNAHPMGRWSALHQAAKSGNKDAVHLLLSRKADANLKNSEGRMAVDYASGDDVRSALRAAIAGTSPSASSSGQLKRPRSAVDLLSDGEGGAAASGASAMAGDKRAKLPKPVADMLGVTGGASYKSPGSSGPSASAGRAPGSSGPAKSRVSQTSGKFNLHSDKGFEVGGSYKFDPKSQTLYDNTGFQVGVFVDEAISAYPFPETVLADPWSGTPRALPCVSVVDSEIMEEVQKPQNAHAYFVLPSQLNGAEYPSHSSIITEISQYR